MDLIFTGSKRPWAHRTLRTIFDKYSAEWNRTSIEEKGRIILTLIKNREDLHQLIIEFQKRYRENGMEYVADDIIFALVEILASWSEKYENQKSTDICKHLRKTIMSITDPKIPFKKLELAYTYLFLSKYVDDDFENKKLCLDIEQTIKQHFTKKHKDKIGGIVDELWRRIFENSIFTELRFFKGGLPK
ncbi:MAG: hypothetical protein H8E17_16585 [Deltaproteobacteria bacterium]|nr:hypothetical protein [Deltaproteobacteria bacterium]